MTTRADQETAVRDALVWLQEQMTQVRDQMAHLQQEADDALGRLTSLQEQVDEVHGGQAQAEQLGGAVGNLRAEIGEVRELAAQLRERLSSADLRQEEAARQRDLEVERERQARTALAQRLDDLNETGTAVEQRMNVLVEAQRRYQEAAISLRQEADALRATVSGLQSRESTHAEALHRLEAGLGGLDARAGELEHIHEAMAERLQLAAEHGRQLEREIGAIVMPRLEGIDEVAEQMNVLRAERARFESRLQALELRLDRADEVVEEQTGMAAKLQGRLQGVDERLAQLQADLTGLNETVVTQMVRFGQTLERQKRRQMGDLEREIRELKQHATRLSEE